MKFAVISDIHDNMKTLNDMLNFFVREGVEKIVFCGDFCSPIPARRLGRYLGEVHCVFGNNDADRFAMLQYARDQAPNLILHGEHAELTWEGLEIALTHYPFYARALAGSGKYDLVFSGHTHEYHEERIGGTLWINPGDVMGLKAAPSCVIYDTESKTHTKHEFAPQGSQG